MSLASAGLLAYGRRAMTDTVLETDRLLLRPMTDADREPFAAMNADPEVMRWFPETLSRAESDAAMDRIRDAVARNGFGWNAIEVKGGPGFIGFVGLNVPGYALPFGPCVEIGWRLAREAWGQGYASEGARACLAFGFGRLGLAEIVSFTAVGNQRSQAVMQRLGMTRDLEGDFDHPVLAPHHPLARHVLYRLQAS